MVTPLCLLWPFLTEGVKELHLPAISQELLSLTDELLHGEIKG